MARRLLVRPGMSTPADPDPYLRAYQTAFAPELDTAVDEPPAMPKGRPPKTGHASRPRPKS